MALGTTVKVKNTTGSTINVGKAVYLSGFDEDEFSPVIIIGLASYLDDAKMPAIGVVVEDLPNNEIGSIKVSGHVGGIDTSSNSVNDKVYVGSGGNLIFQEPLYSSGNYTSQQIGVVSKVGELDGQIFLFPLEVKRKTSHTQLLDVLADQHHPQLHAEKHADGQEDELSHRSLADIGSYSHVQIDSHLNNVYLHDNTVVAKTLSGSITVAQNKSTFTNEGASGSVSLTLPTAASRLSYTFYKQANQTFKVIANSGDTLRIAGSVSALAGNVELDSVGTSITILAINSTEWITTALIGSVTVT